MGKGLLLSARPVSDELRGRARDNQVDILAAEQVRDMVTYLKSWMSE
jgi:hypothetical protein